MRLNFVVKESTLDGSGSFRFVVSRPTDDRDKEVVLSTGLTLQKRVPVYADHRRTMEWMVGSGAPTLSGSDLILDGKFSKSPLAQSIRELLADEEHREAIGMSIGLISARKQVIDGKPHIVGGELMECSFTGIPSNRDTELLDLKSIDDIEEKAAMSGSYEHRTELVMAAVRTSEGAYAHKVAMTDSEVVYETIGAAGYVTRARSYALDGSKVTVGDAIDGVMVTEFRPNKATKNAADGAVVDPARSGSTAALSPAVARSVADSSAAARAALALHAGA